MTQIVVNDDEVISKLASDAAARKEFLGKLKDFMRVSGLDIPEATLDKVVDRQLKQSTGFRAADAGGVVARTVAIITIF